MTCRFQTDSTICFLDRIRVDDGEEFGKAFGRVFEVKRLDNNVTRNIRNSCLVRTFSNVDADKKRNIPPR